MSRNVEIKSRLNNMETGLRRASELADSDAVEIRQEDFYFRVPDGRLKLRVFSPSAAQLIFYRRPNAAGPKVSDYRIVEADRPAELRSVLEAACGLRNVVRKTRWLFMRGRTRIHIDRVEGLGDFLEIEVVMQPDEPENDGETEARVLMDMLGLSESDLIPESYIIRPDSRILYRFDRKPFTDPKGRAERFCGIITTARPPGRA